MGAVLPTSASDLENQRLAATAERAGYRDYEQVGIDRVRTFYRNNHTHQTFDFVQAKKAKWLQFNTREMTPWEGLDFLNTLVDESDPDINLPQIAHLLQTAEAIKADGYPDWFVLTGFIHDLDKVHMSWGHDGYLYQLLKDYLPEPALYMIRYHSFYSWHREEQYGHLTDEKDRANLAWVRKFNPYDLYSKNPNPPVLSELKPYYEDLMAKYLPDSLKL